METTPQALWRILLAEDELEVRTAYCTYLKEGIPSAEIMAVPNGQMALNVARDEHPDLIITDWEMPELNGIDLIRELRDQEETSAIPVIMLTGIHVDTEHLCRGLDTGATEFLRKPLEKQEFIARVRSILDLVQRNRALRQRERIEILTKPESLKAASMDEQFLFGLRACMSKHLDNEDLTVEQLSEEMALSRTQLHRKLKTLLNQSISEFIRDFRLERAEQLLQQDAAPVSEVAYMVGFSSASYFSKVFSAQTGLSPREYRNRYKAEASVALGSSEASGSDSDPGDALTTSAEVASVKPS